eukprot:Skav207202  [mRNA]  locus=scaffold2886:13733:18410:- [translate_table: standard]
MEDRVELVELHLGGFEIGQIAAFCFGRVRQVPGQDRHAKGRGKPVDVQSIFMESPKKKQAWDSEADGEGEEPKAERLVGRLGVQPGDVLAVVVIFVKSVQRAVALDKLLARPQEETGRDLYKQFKEFQKRILVATDLFGRGIDIERVNIVINYDMPDESDSYLHRVGRAGRFGTKGLAVTFVATDEDQEAQRKTCGAHASKT